LARLRKRLDGPLAYEQKRRITEILVAGIQVDTVETCGVKQAEVTVTYRFSQPDEPTTLLLPQSYRSRVPRIPLEPKTVGDHIRKSRLQRKLLQKDVARQIGVDTTSVVNWESNWVTPEIRYMPAIIAFLGYNPLPEGQTVGEKLVRCRTGRGMSQKQAAARLGVDPGTLARWERGEREPMGRFTEQVAEFMRCENPPASSR
jgi:transcriptional regulator with XRE-family HTH domain